LETKTNKKLEFGFFLKGEMEHNFKGTLDIEKYEI
jgi:hypothetical protein